MSNPSAYDRLGTALDMLEALHSSRNQRCRYRGQMEKMSEIEHEISEARDAIRRSSDKLSEYMHGISNVTVELRRVYGGGCE